MTGFAYLDTETTGLHPTLHEVWEIALIVDASHQMNYFVPEDSPLAALKPDAILPSDTISTSENEGPMVVHSNTPHESGRDRGRMLDLRWLVVEERVWQIPARRLDVADPFALAISGYYERLRLPVGDGPGGSPATAVRLGKNSSNTNLLVVDVIDEFIRLTAGKHIVGAIPSFDTQRLEQLIRDANLQPRWHYHIIDVEALAVGYLRGRQRQLELDRERLRATRQGAAMHPKTLSWDHVWDDFDPQALPWSSDALSRACGIEPPSEDDRHTALGDARWARRLHRKVMGLD